jgi:hypothetical protein
MEIKNQSKAFENFSGWHAGYFSPRSQLLSVPILKMVGQITAKSSSKTKNHSRGLNFFKDVLIRI